jgi:hypothetical protein
MGRTVPTFRQLIDDAIARWSKFRRALRREDQEYFDRLFRRVRSYTQAATYQASDNPMEAILLSIALDQEKRLDVLERAVPPPGLAADCTFALNAPSETCSPQESGAGSTWRPQEESLGSTWSPQEESLGSTFTLNAAGEVCSPPEAGGGSTWSPQEESPGSTWSPQEESLGSTWSPPQESLEQLDVSRSAGENEQPDTHLRPDPGPRLDTGPQRNPGKPRNTGQQPNTTAWLDFRSVPEPARDEAVADRAEPETPPSD